jgi:prepilin-type N-terminal cleavage/methylation domain-containing protein
MVRRRDGFTLVEMLVVIVIILVIASLVVALTPKLAGNQKVVSASDLLQGWLLNAKQRALRDQMPTGIRLLPGATTTNYVTDVQYIQQPPDFTVAPGVVSDSGGNLYPVRRLSITAGSTTATLEGSGPPDFSGNISNSAYWPVQTGDYLDVYPDGLVHQISAVAANTLTLSSAVTNAVNLTQQYRIIRSPRVLTGEKPLQLPQDTAIDVNSTASVSQGTTNNGLSAPPTDILFSPSGGVLGWGTAQTDRIILWVRDVTLDSQTDGDPRLVVINVRTGFIAVHPIDAVSGNYYTFATDNRSSGL